MHASEEVVEEEKPPIPEDDDEMGIDGGVMLSVATSPIPKAQGRKMGTGNKGRTDEVMQNAKARDAMIQQQPKHW